MSRDEIRQAAIKLCEQHDSVNMFYMLNRMEVPKEDEEVSKMYRMVIKEMVTSVLADMYWVTTTYPEYYCDKHVAGMANFFMARLKAIDK